MTPAELLGFAHELADTADEGTMARFGGPVPAATKPDGSPVTEADRAVESALRDQITASYPHHAVCGEEGGGEIDPAVPTWVLDPIDGTKNFMRGMGVFATLIALMHQGRALVGIASAPAMGERWTAAAGMGAQRNGRPVGVSAIADLADAHVCHGGLEWFRRSPAMWEALGQIVDRCWRARGFGDFWQHLLVAGGMADAAFEHDLKPWDIAALLCIVEEAGGVMTGWDGGPALDQGWVLTTNGLLHDELQILLTGARSQAPPGDGS